jgi:fused signal recognition particle receptor
MGLFDRIKSLVSKDNNKEFKKYEDGLRKSSQTFSSRLKSLALNYQSLDEDYFMELEEILIMADVGVNTVMEFVDRLRERAASEGFNTPDELSEIIVDELFLIYVSDSIVSTKINYNPNGLTVILMVGVNGAGKTTTIAKLATKMKAEGKKVIVAAGDTFRAGAVDQLDTWAQRVGVKCVRGEENRDPSSVMFDAINTAKADQADVLICDTAGRLQNKVNLMKELEKINRVIEREVEGAPHETLLVIDATTGQNGISQATNFTQATNVTGIVLTKLDGTAKGGIVLAIREKVNIPVKFVGLGETVDDLQEFDIEKYIYGLFKDLFN